MPGLILLVGLHPKVIGHPQNTCLKVVTKEGDVVWIYNQALKADSTKSYQGIILCRILLLLYRM